MYSENSKDEINFLYRIFKGDRSIYLLPERLSIYVTISLIDKTKNKSYIVPGWEYTKVEPEHKGNEMLTGRIHDRYENREMISEAWTLSIPVNRLFNAAKKINSDRDLFEFSSLFFENFKVQLDLEYEGVKVSSDQHFFEIYNEPLFGSLYKRVMDDLIGWDTTLQVEKANTGREIGIEYHPWFPVLCIGTEKANLYMKAIIGDVVEEKRMLTDPGWLLRVGLYLELLTCLGIIEVVKEKGKDLLTKSEREIFDHSPYFKEIRDRIDIPAWEKVWKARKMDISGFRPNANMPVSFTNLLRKKATTLLFLHAHHDDLKHAIELAGVNIHNSQETWHRVFRDAERAVLKMDQEAFPELNYLTKDVKKFVLWHERGNYFGFRLIPKKFSGSFGDQDGLYLSACREYKESMNHVAEWAREKGFMEYTGNECVPSSASILENFLMKNYGRLKYLQNQDGYNEGIDVEEREDSSTERFPFEKIYSTLSTVSIFKTLQEDELKDLSKRARPIELGHLERIIVQGREGSSLFVLHEGTLEVVSRIDEVDQVLANLQKGAVIGEFSFLTGEKRTAAVRAIDFALMIEVSADNLRPIVEKRPGLIKELAKTMEARKNANENTLVDKNLMSKISSTLFGRK